MGLESGVTLGAVAAKSAVALSVLEKHQIDYYCCGQRLLTEACSEAAIAVEDVLAELEAVDGEREGGTDWSAAPLRDLIRHIVETHHEFLKLELPKTNHRIKAMLASHGSHADTLGALQKSFNDFARELDLHMQKEEAVLFPMIERLESAARNAVPLPSLPFGSIENPIGVMEAEHAATDQSLREMRRLIRDFSAGFDGSEEVAALLELLHSLELDLHVHMHLENNILFPRTIALESRAL